MLALTIRATLAGSYALALGFLYFSYQWQINPNVFHDQFGAFGGDPYLGYAILFGLIGAFLTALDILNK
jgi:hypothetical protein